MKHRLHNTPCFPVLSTWTVLDSGVRRTRVPSLYCLAECSGPGEASTAQYSVLSNALHLDRPRLRRSPDAGPSLHCLAECSGPGEASTAQYSVLSNALHLNSPRLRRSPDAGPSLQCSGPATTLTTQLRAFHLDSPRLRQPQDQYLQ